MMAIGYMRRSATVRLEEQEARIRAYCESQGWTLVGLVTEERSWWRQGVVGLADLVRALEARPLVERVVLPPEALAELEAEAAQTWAMVRAWCEARQVRVIGVPAHSV